MRAVCWCLSGRSKRAACRTHPRAQHSCNHDRCCSEAHCPGFGQPGSHGALCIEMAPAQLPPRLLLPICPPLRPGPPELLKLGQAAAERGAYFAFGPSPRVRLNKCEPAPRAGHAHGPAQRRPPPGAGRGGRARRRPAAPRGSKRKISPPLRPSQPELGAREGSGAERGARVELHAAEQDRWTGARLVGGVVTQRTASGYNEVSHADGRRQLCKGVQWSVAESRLAASRGAPLHRCEGANGRGERRVRWN